MNPRGGAAEGRGTAVVIGGGLAGCLAAWALHGVAERIVVVERDRYPDGVGFRAGVPQARHCHLLLEAGRRTLDELMPGIVGELVADGANRILLGGVSWLTAEGWLARHQSDLAVLICSRPLIDHAVLKRVRALPNVEFRTATEVTGLLGDGGTVTGVRLVGRGTGNQGTDGRGTDGEPETEIAAELVVDASGRRTRAPEWLAALGVPAVPEERVDAGISYATRFYRRPAGTPDDLAYYLQCKAPERGRLGLLMPIEGNRWMVGLGGMRGFEPSVKEEEFEEQLGGLRHPGVAEAIVGAEPIGPIRGFAPGPSVWRHYERSALRGFLAIGDSSCAFNPVYGQGMSVASFSARALRDAARKHEGIGEAVVRETRQAVSAAAKGSWELAAGEDVRFPATVGGPAGLPVRLQHRLMDRVLARAATDGKVADAFLRVASLVAPPTLMFRPSVLGRVLFGR
ncbi:MULTISPECIES: FAD-dependent monooxygenase [Kitasatospora]|uniref:FAD-binding domain-containing protein n=1 Tax=Kitasatospora setae (strain ATCC 33774 / DSM 43861 / JCM 3304 / KCC A-0304 / NBRC 14216 / KM-6054) TaxID=452652 RepID=E4N6J7_KITSK|nr:MULTISPECIES: FAD-dependent monooxygenase [Kitasatospora]BAJ26828.1 hypothetical protein KSE_09920 [Kitasatospora setae KM-6054]